MKINVNTPKPPTPVGVSIKDLKYGELYMVDSVDWSSYEGCPHGGKHLAGLYLMGVNEFRSLSNTQTWYGLKSGVTVTNPRLIKSATIDVTLEEA